VAQVWRALCLLKVDCYALEPLEPRRNTPEAVRFLERWWNAESTRFRYNNKGALAEQRVRATMTTASDAHFTSLVD
jgi:hypothetical protein